MARLCARALPDDVVEKAKHHILGTFAAPVPGTELPPAKAASRFAASHGGSGDATRVTAGTTAGAFASHGPR